MMITPWALFSRAVSRCVSLPDIELPKTVTLGSILATDLSCGRTAMTGCRLIFCLLLSTQLLAGCLSLPSVAQRTAHADALAAAKGWQRVHMPVESMVLVAYLPRSPRPESVLTVYIEGDGLAWISNSRPSLNPTPSNPLALQLALAQPQGNAAYLARPCQYLEVSPSACQQGYWTDARFSEAVIAASDAALNHLKQRFAARELQLVGYSGGGAVATLLAARRDDVVGLVTVAGNLDHQRWSEMLRLSPLQRSLNPALARDRLRGLRQWHLVGALDRVIPPVIAQQFVAGLPDPTLARIQVMDGVDHQCCWVDFWPRFWPEVAR